jgi:LuxR family transcriptional regulator, regulator of acetate metabolism
MAGPDDAVHIHRALTRIRPATGLPLAFGGPVNRLRQLQLSEFDGANTGVMRGVTLDPGRGLGGKVVSHRRPMALNDYVDASNISHHYDRFIKAEALRALVAVPIIVQRTVRGVLYGALRTAVPLGDRVVRSVVDIARDLEQTLAVQDHLTRQLDWLAERSTVPRPDEPSTPEWELVRETYAELRVLLQDVQDDQLRQRMDAVCNKLAAACTTDAQPRVGSSLSTREIDVLACVALGWTNSHIAADLGLRDQTVKSYLRSAMRKLNAHSRLEAVVTARRLGLLP